MTQSTISCVTAALEVIALTVGRCYVGNDITHSTVLTVPTQLTRLLLKWLIIQQWTIKSVGRTVLILVKNSADTASVASRHSPGNCSKHRRFGGHMASTDIKHVQRCGSRVRSRDFPRNFRFPADQWRRVIYCPSNNYEKSFIVYQMVAYNGKYRTRCTGAKLACFATGCSSELKEQQNDPLVVRI